jgi:hypothetical protein
VKKWQKIKGYFARSDKMEILTKEAQDRAADLERSILSRDLQLIEDQFKLSADLAKRERLLQWLNRDVPKGIGGPPAVN